MFKETDDALTAELEFTDFKAAFEFMTAVASLAETQQHHPEWKNVYNRVSIRLTTHDADNSITERDRKLASAIESLAVVEKLQPRVL